MTPAPVGLALVACFFFSLSVFLQQIASKNAPGRTGGLAGVHSLLGTLIRHPLWAVGHAVNFVGFVIQAVALHHGSVGVVQLIMPTQLVFALVLASARARHWPSARDWGSVVAIVAGIALILATTDTPTGVGTTHITRIGVLAAIDVVAIALALVIAHGRPPRIAAVLTATGAGFCFASTAVVLKLVADRVATDGLLSLWDFPGLYGLLLTTGTGLVLTQAALAAGPLPWAVAAMSITEPVVGYAFGLIAYRAPLPSPEDAIPAVILLGLGVIGLATTNSAQRWTPAHHLG